jgi:hypothetical protein
MVKTGITTNRVKISIMKNLFLGNQLFPQVN